MEAFASAADWETWLAERHATADVCWIKFAKKGSGLPTVTYAEALDVALCWGWIDGQVAKLDGTHYLQRFTPRRARSKWSQRNREHVARLEAAGRMQPPGRAEVERAKADGRWDAAYPSPANMAVPGDLQAALDADPVAAAAFAALDGQNRYAILYRLHDAQRPETRARRVAQFTQLLREGRRPLDP